MKRMEWLEAMRGIAAMWVLLCHTGMAVRDFVGGHEIRLVANGYLGVDFFFVLSGFIIAHSSEQLAVSGRGLREYVTARALRIYIPYLPVGLTMLAALSVFPSLSAGTRNEVSILSSLTLLPSSAPPALSLAWTLVHEMVFYAVFSLFFISRKLLVAVLVIWALAIIAAWATRMGYSRMGSYVLSPLNLCFVLGVALSWFTRRGLDNRIAFACVAAGVVLVTSQALMLQPNRMLVAIGFAGLVAAARAPAALAARPGGVLLTLGAASYALYLVHSPVISLVVRAVRNLPPLPAFLLLSCAALVAGLAYHAFYERRALRWVRARIAGSPRPAPILDARTSVAP